jgi:hypothetical protein
MSLLDIGGVRAKQSVPLFLRDERSKGYDGAHHLTAIGPICKETPYRVGPLFDRAFPVLDISAGIPSDELVNIQFELSQAVWGKARGRT